MLNFGNIKRSGGGGTVAASPLIGPSLFHGYNPHNGVDDRRDCLLTIGETGWARELARDIS